MCLCGGLMSVCELVSVCVCLCGIVCVCVCMCVSTCACACIIHAAYGNGAGSEGV